MSRFTLAPSAREDMRAIWHYIGVAQCRPDAARKRIENMRRRFRLLAQNPLLGELREDLADTVPGVRSFSAGSYVIYYRPTNCGIQVGRVLHGARDVRTAFEEGMDPGA